MSYCSRYSRCLHSVGGLTTGLVVELANGAQAVVLDVTDEAVKLDANHMLAGRTLTFELELVSIDRQNS